MACQEVNGTIWTLRIDGNDGAAANGDSSRLRAQTGEAVCDRQKTRKALLAGPKAIVAGFQKRGDKLATTTLAQLFGDQ
jgi:hypothetical protein